VLALTAEVNPVVVDWKNDVAPDPLDARSLSRADRCLFRHDQHRMRVDRADDHQYYHPYPTPKPGYPAILRTEHFARMSSLAWIDLDEAKRQHALSG
jgi:hypothetical protein